MNRIIVVDDDEEVLETIQLVLELGGFDVLALNDGANLFSAINDFHPHLIILDIVLGKLDGRQINNDLKSNPIYKHIPVLLMSGLFNTDDINALATPPDGFLPKPFKMEVLIDKIASLISKNKERQHIN